MKPLRVNDPVTVFQSTDNRTYTLFQGYVVNATLTAFYIKSVLHTRYHSIYGYRYDDEGVTWVRGHVTRRHAAGRALVTAARLLR